MAYVTDAVDDVDELLTAIRNACTANGWTLSGSVLHRGAVYVELTTASGALVIQGGTGVDVGNALTGAGPAVARIRSLAAQALTYPMTVEVHILTDPDEVYVVVNYATSYYQLLAWGQSDAPGLSGTGVWYHGSVSSVYGEGSYSAGPAGGAISNAWNASPAAHPAFWVVDVNAGAACNSFIHGDVDARGWHGTAAAGIASSFCYVAPLIGIQPNLWNGEAILLPFPIYVPRSAGSKYSMVADLKHVRHCRVDNHEPGDIVTLGTDQWKVYPWYLKNSAFPSGGTRSTHSGCLGFAVRYTGP